jgi:hypothetical protein
LVRVFPRQALEHDRGLASIAGPDLNSLFAIPHWGHFIDRLSHFKATAKLLQKVLASRRHDRLRRRLASLPDCAEEVAKEV